MPSVEPLVCVGDAASEGGQVGEEREGPVHPVWQPQHTGDTGQQSRKFR